MPSHAMRRPTLWDTVVAFLTLVVAYLSLTVRVSTGRHTLKPRRTAGGREAFGADEQWPDDLRSMQRSMEHTQEIPVQSEDDWAAADIWFDRTEDARDRYEEWPDSDVDREEVSRNG